MSHATIETRHLPLISDDLTQFVQSSIGSVWALRLMVTIRNDPRREWAVHELVREMRASTFIISQLLPRLQQIGLVTEAHPGAWVWKPANPELTEMAERVTRTFAETPFALIEIVAKTPPERLQHFVDAFLLRED